LSFAFVLQGSVTLESQPTTFLIIERGQNGSNLLALRFSTDKKTHIKDAMQLGN